MYCKFKNDDLEKSFVKVFINNQYHNRNKKQLFIFQSFYFEVLPYLKFEISIKKRKKYWMRKNKLQKKSPQQYYIEQKS